MVALTFCISAMLGLLVTSSSNGNEDAALERPSPAKSLALTVHDTILIDGNAGFNNASGVVWGSGTESDPYIIADWEISALLAHGIIIQGTDAHFVVRNCYVHDGSTLHYHGILLTSCVNGTLENNTCANNRFGISLQSSSDNKLFSNNCSDSWNGNDISLSLSSNNTMIGNSAGVSLGSSSNSNTIIRNGGVILDSSSNNTVIENHGRIGLLYSSNNNTIAGNNCLHSGILLMWSCNNNTLIDNDCSEVDGDIGAYGMRLYSSSGNFLINNTCNLSTLCGLSLSTSSNHNTLIGNDISSNKGYGISVSSSNDNRIWNNTFINNWIQASDTGINNRWNSTDGYGNYWSDWTTPDVDPPFGIVDLPYNISGWAGAKDYYPLTTTPAEPIPEFGVMPLVALILLVAVLLTTGARRRKAE